MNKIEFIRTESLRYLGESQKVVDSFTTIISPDNMYKVETREFILHKTEFNWSATQIKLVDISGLNQPISFVVNEGAFFHSWVDSGPVKYLLCSEDLCGGQTVVDLTNWKLSSYSENNDGFIWTKHLLSPDKKKLAVFGCGWGSPFFIMVYDFTNPMKLPLPEIHQPDWSGYDMIAWIDNCSMLVHSEENNEAIVHI